MAKKCEEDQVDDLIAQSMIANSLEKNHRNITGSSVLEPAVSGKDFEDPMDKYLADRLAKLRRYPAVFIMSVHFFFFSYVFSVLRLQNRKFLHMWNSILQSEPNQHHYLNFLMILWKEMKMNKQMR